ncbi:hypothetical protein CFE70_001066 [Pyrenophora teres f. teres 0-1]|uniref:Uncharacterized protein n=2 Tax=Pyrenophora teres f. teres TaxID=97479 RepID=E3RLK1_PYRTT|nr:hypothetical protein PTT_09254 [Pyrenophora teres f. teres 0-1]KAE8822820.1 hypothetical protein HRS9139_10160 [Pyrenophora teres f. teres]KAE8826052.1 hypothetical protein PTNB85_08997 [Pyrenophora teres f. teres]KAE8832939.1 hypothetical protein HRS9122_08652 [Pyrenophora teres f. teres]KAE8852889.1 hypothetical protein PTNB29_10279 [Pyrenophora teres f. teres]
MSYYRCSADNLRQETDRRGFNTDHSTKDELAEYLKQDDEARGSDATTMETRKPDEAALKDASLAYKSYLDQKATAHRLINQKITHWTMNTFFPSLQLFFESGYSCTITIAYSSTPSSVATTTAKIGVDPALKFKLTDCTHEENGRVTNSILPPKHANSGMYGLVIEDACVAQRTSVALETGLAPGAAVQQAKTRIVTERHTVFGLKLKGVESIAYVWAKAECHEGGCTWVDVSIGGLRNDVPLPFACFPDKDAKPGASTTVVVMESLIGKAGRRERRVSA